MLVTLQGLPLLVYTRTFGLKAEAPTLDGFRHRVSGVVPALTSELRIEDCQRSPSCDVGHMVIGELEGVGTGLKALYMTLLVQLARGLACCLFSVPCPLSEWFIETWAPSLSSWEEGSLLSTVHCLFTNLKNSRLPTAKKPPGTWVWQPPGLRNREDVTNFPF